MLSSNQVNSVSNLVMQKPPFLSRTLIYLRERSVRMLLMMISFTGKWCQAIQALAWNFPGIDHQSHIFLLLVQPCSVYFKTRRAARDETYRRLFFGSSLLFSRETEELGISMSFLHAWYVSDNHAWVNIVGLFYSFSDICYIKVCEMRQLSSADIELMWENGRFVERLRRDLIRLFRNCCINKAQPWFWDQTQMHKVITKLELIIFFVRLRDFRGIFRHCYCPDSETL